MSYSILTYIATIATAAIAAAPLAAQETAPTQAEQMAATPSALFAARPLVLGASTNVPLSVRSDTTDTSAKAKTTADSQPKAPDPFAFADFSWLNGNSR